MQFVEYINQLIPLLHEVSARKSLPPTYDAEIQPLGQRIKGETAPTGIAISRIVSRTSFRCVDTAGVLDQDLDADARTHMMLITDVIKDVTGG